MPHHDIVWTFVLRKVLISALNALEQQLFEGDKISPRQMKRFLHSNQAVIFVADSGENWLDMHCYYFIKVHSYQGCIQLPLNLISEDGELLRIWLSNVSVQLLIKAPLH